MTFLRSLQRQNNIYFLTVSSKYTQVFSRFPWLLWVVKKITSKKYRNCGGEKKRKKTFQKSFQMFCFCIRGKLIR